MHRKCFDRRRFRRLARLARPPWSAAGWSSCAKPVLVNQMPRRHSGRHSTTAPGCSQVVGRHRSGAALGLSCASGRAWAMAAAASRSGRNWLQPLHPLHYAQRLFYMNAGCAHDAPGKVDQAYVARLLNLCDAMPAGFKVMLFAFERFHDGQRRRASRAFGFLRTECLGGASSPGISRRVSNGSPPCIRIAYRCGRPTWKQAISRRRPRRQMAAGGDGHGSGCDARCDAFYRVLARERYGR